MTLLSLMSVLGFILLDVYFCLSYEKVNYCNIRNSIIKNYYRLIGNTF